MFIFGTIIAYGVKMTIKVSNHRFDIEALKSVLRNSSFIFLLRMLIFGIMITYDVLVSARKVSGSQI